MTDKITKALETVNELHGETLEQLEDDLPLVGYLITVSAILRSEGREEWADKISRAASKINDMQKHIRILQEIIREDMKELVQYRAENEKLRAALAEEKHYGEREHREKMSHYQEVYDAEKVIVELRAENERLRAALKPFAESVGPETDMMSSAALSASIFTFGQLRAAAAALKETGDE